IPIPLRPLRHTGREPRRRQPRYRPCRARRCGAARKPGTDPFGGRRQHPSRNGRSRMMKLAAKVSPLAGKTIEPSMLVNLPRLVTAYFTGKPDPTVPSQRVAFGTSGHRGSAFENGFNEAHILAISQAICHQRRRSGITGPLFIGIDTHALSEPAFASAL